MELAVLDCTELVDVKAVEHEVECDPDDRVDAYFDDDGVAGYAVAFWLELELAVDFGADSVDLLD